MNLPGDGRVYSMSFEPKLGSQGMLVVGTAGQDRSIHTFDLSKPDQPISTITSPLKYQTRVVACFGGQNPGIGYCVGSISGRCAVQYVIRRRERERRREGGRGVI